MERFAPSKSVLSDRLQVVVEEDIDERCCAGNKRILLDYFELLGEGDRFEGFATRKGC